MHEIAIPFVVVIGPTVFALVLEFVSEETRKTIWWKVGVGMFGVGLSWNAGECRDECREQTGRFQIFRLPCDLPS
jgi:hypothetical protein